jgi:cyclophilin family peptidyl-prolyl cis-trans isomerase
MRMNLKISSTLFLLILLSTNLFSQEKEQKVLITTKYGNMTVKLYNETPLHRDNFIKLTKEAYYNDLLFHRVIKDFMIQGGDPESKNAPSAKRLGMGGPGYEIPAEINPKFFHKKGALAAARSGDNVNPERKSSGSQFYIVMGNVWTDESLRKFEEKQKFQAVRTEGMKMYREKQQEINRLQTEGKTDSANAILNSIQLEAEKKVDATKFIINEERRSAYTTIGGTPFLDDTYTVFGEVIDGLNVIDSIGKVPTAPGDRPLEDVIMKVEVIE